MQHKKIIISSGVFLVFIAIIALNLPTKPQQIIQPHPAAVIKPIIPLGVWTEGFYDAESQTLHPEKLVAFEKLTNKKFSIAHYYRGWEALSDPTLLTEFEQIRNNNWEPMLNVNPYYFASCPVSTLSIYQAITAGKCDKFLHAAGKNLSNISQPFYLLFAWEMNNKDLSWSIPYTKSSPSDFIAAWRHIHDIFKEENATSVTWVFCPNIPDVADTSYQTIYPGDAYVDWTCLDGYNWGTTQSWSKWSDFAGVFTSSYATLTRIAPSKPMMIGEVNTTDQGGDKAVWYKDMFEKQIPNNFPQIKAVTIFNEDKTKQEKVNWDVAISASSLNAFIEGIHFPYYK